MSTRVATPLEQVSIWRRAGGEGEPFVASVNPYTYWGEASASGPRTAGVLVAWRVASAHLQEDRRERGMLWWHLSGVVLTIWRTRHGTVDQILSKLAEIEAKHPA